MTRLRRVYIGMGVDKNFSTLMSWSNENESCMRVDESSQAKVCMRVL